MDEQQTWIITGAGRGLGLALTRRVLEAGHHVVATTRGGEMPFRHPELTVLPLEVADRASCCRAAADVVQRRGRVDVLVNNAGYGLVGAIEEVSEAEVRAILDVDLLGPLWMTQAVLPTMRAQGGGDVVQISSVGGVGAMPFFGMYNAAKWGLEGFTEALAGEVADAGVRVTLVEIGAMDTQWATTSMQFSRPHPAYDEVRTRVLGTVEVPWPAGEGSTGGGASPAAIAEHLVTYLASGTSGPLRLILGDDAVEQIEVVLARRARDYTARP